jgi:DNA-binding protein H-NS
MNNLVDIQSQIEKLQKQAAEIKEREFAKTVQDIRAKMQAFGIAIKDLQSAAPGGRKGKAAASAKVKVTEVKKKKTGVVVAAKYRGPNGETWSGRGLTPRWLATLIAQGQSKDDFAIKS